jgi:four helix bundle protein
VASNFRKLTVWQEAVALADELSGVVARWDPFERWSVGIQLMRSVDSIAANIAEGTGRESRADQRRFYYMARGSLCETEHWLLRAEARGLVEAGTADRLDVLARTLNGLIRRDR